MSRLSRRGILGGAAALMPGAAVGTGVSPSPANPDAALIVACAEFGRLEAELNRPGLTDDERDALVDQVYEQQGPHLHVIVTAPCTTLAGLQAIVRAWTTWDGTLLADGPDDPGDCLAGKVAETVLALRGAA